jgi:hypothetical protein
MQRSYVLCDLRANSASEALVPKSPQKLSTGNGEVWVRLTCVCVSVCAVSAVRACCMYAVCLLSLCMRCECFCVCCVACVGRVDIVCRLCALCGLHVRCVSAEYVL